MSGILKIERNTPMWSWTARFIEGTNIVMSTSCENVTEIYKYNEIALSRESKNIKDFICNILEDQDLLEEYKDKSYLTLIDVIK